MTSKLVVLTMLVLFAFGYGCANNPPIDDTADAAADTDTDTDTDTDVDTDTDADTDSDSDTAAKNKPGVISGGECYPLCVTVTEGSDPDNLDWGYEDNESCVIPGTITATSNQACNTLEKLPDNSGNNGKPGVVVVLDNETGVKTCVLLCTGTLDVADDPDGDGWSYEFDTSCVIPNSDTAKNQSCIIGEDISDKVSVPGVVVVLDSEAPDDKICVALCTITTTLEDDPDGDGWSWEDNDSCVIPGTATAETNLDCMTGAEIPADVPREGVEVFLKEDNTCVTDCLGELICVADCTFYTDPAQQGANDDGFGDDWGWENSSSCIIPDTMTSFNTACTTMTAEEDLPKPATRPGIMVNGDPAENSCKWSKCVPICQFVTEPSDSEYPDWGWEDNNSCVLRDTPTATQLPDGDVPRGCKDDPENPATTDDDCYYQYSPRECTWGEDPVDFLAPPAVDGHFTVTGAQLIDPNGNPFLIRGLNNSDAWYDTCGQYMAYHALDNIADAGANAVRIGWAFKTIDPVGPDSGEPEKNIIGTTPTLLAEILYRVVELGMIPVIGVNDTTGQHDVEWPTRMAEYYTESGEPGYMEVLKAYESYLLVGLGNEWNGAKEDFFAAYDAGIQAMRTAGLNNTLVITANDWGQGCDSILDNAALLLDSDPQHNLIFDIHIYTYLTYLESHGGSAEMVQGCLDDIAANNIPLLIGEFGHEHSSGEVEWEAIIERADANNQGYTPWIWFGDTEYPVLDMNESWDGPLTTWGEDVLPMGGVKATIF